MVCVSKGIISRMSGSFAESIRKREFDECYKILMIRELPQAEFRMFEAFNMVSFMKHRWLSHFLPIKNFYDNIFSHFKEGFPTDKQLSILVL